MKKWLKKHSKHLVIGLAVLSIATLSYGASVAIGGWIIALYGLAIALWVVVLILVFRNYGNLFNWWDKE